MSTLLLALAVAAGSANQVVECPATHQGKRLTGAGMYEGEDKIELMGAPRRVQGGSDNDFGFNRGDVKWVACWYERSTPIWYRISPAVTHCDVKERGAAPGKVSAIVRCK